MKTFFIVSIVLGAVLGFSDGKKGLIQSPQCSPVKCEEPCYINSEAEPCPTCECPPQRMCSNPKSVNVIEFDHLKVIIIMEYAPLFSLLPVKFFGKKWLRFIPLNQRHMQINLLLTTKLTKEN
ncbi:hypothetical protein NPIL_327911 [Nephila pilipes]|uniref:Spider venom protein n=1 Tax=Nephila pilipes TaxID=299642 RepID=A0A8X6USE9_NEPPI|nr:hypothetical protein NPIL_327911 [Nephila pilipes]